MYIIKNVTNLDGSISEWAYRIGRVGTPSFEIREGLPLMFIYPADPITGKESYFSTSIIKKVEYITKIGSPGVIVTTANTIYTLEEI